MDELDYQETSYHKSRDRFCSGPTKYAFHTLMEMAKNSSNWMEEAKRTPYLAKALRELNQLCKTTLKRKGVNKLRAGKLYNMIVKEVNNQRKVWRDQNPEEFYVVPNEYKVALVESWCWGLTYTTGSVWNLKIDEWTIDYNPMNSSLFKNALFVALGTFSSPPEILLGKRGQIEFNFEYVVQKGVGGEKKLKPTT